MTNIVASSNLKLYILVGSILLMAVGCVSKAKHQDLIDNYQDLAQQKNTLEKDCDENTKKLSGQIATLKDQTTELDKQNAQLNLKAEKLAREKKTETETMKEMVFSLERKLAGEKAKISQLENALKIEVLDTLMFKSGSAVVTRAGSKILAKIAPTLIAATDKDIIIIGHTDDLPPSPNLALKYPSNWELSASRAASIVHILTWNYKIDPTRMTIQGAAHYHPLTTFDAKDNSTRQTNRAVEIILKPKEN